MEEKKKVVKKNAAQIAQLKEALTHYVRPRYNVDVSPPNDEFQVTSKADFIQWLDTTYASKNTSVTTASANDCKASKDRKSVV